MTEMLLLGAGASIEAGIPHAEEMTKQIESKFQEENLRKEAHVLAFVIGGLLFQKGIQGQNPLNSGVNIEDLFNAIKLLAERHTLEAAPFVGSWHTMVDKFDTIEPDYQGISDLYKHVYNGIINQLTTKIPYTTWGPTGRDIDDKIYRLIDESIQRAKNSNHFGGHSSTDISDKVGKYVFEIIKNWLQSASHPNSNFSFDRTLQNILSRKPISGEGRIFDRINAQMIKFLTSFVWIDKQDSVSYLEPILRLQKVQQRLAIASLNYDNAIELLAESSKEQIVCNTGIEEWLQNGVFDSKCNGIFLLKLHGSINWQNQMLPPTQEKPIPQYSLANVSAEKFKEYGFKPAVIFGQRNKLTAEGPFLDLLRAFQRELANADCLTVVGYSFRDDHINTMIGQWLNQSTGHRIRIIDPNFNNNSPRFIRDLMKNGNTRVEVYKKKAGEGLDSLYPPMTSSYIKTEA